MAIILKKQFMTIGERASINLARFYDKIDKIIAQQKWQKAK